MVLILARLKFIGHTAEISKAIFNSQGSKILTASADKTAILWNAEDQGSQLQVLEGQYL